MDLDELKADPKWAYAARIAFALSPNSASCERVFSALKLMFGDQQMSALPLSATTSERRSCSASTSARSAEHKGAARGGGLLQEVAYF